MATGSGSFLMMTMEEVEKYKRDMEILWEQLRNLQQCYEELSIERQQWRLSAIALQEYWERSIEHGDEVGDVINASSAQCIGRHPDAQPWFSTCEVAVSSDTVSDYDDYDEEEEGDDC